MNTNLFVDPLELKDALKIYTDSRFSNELFGLNANNATGEILATLRSSHNVEMLFLDNYSDSILSGVATSGSANSLTLSGAGWTISEFAGNIPIEVLIWNSTNFYVADVTANTADTLTISGVGHEDITPATDDKFYLRLKNPQLNSYAKGLGLYLFIGSNRTARGVEDLSAYLADNQTRIRDELDLIASGQRELMYLKNSDSVTLNGSEWQYLSYNSIVPSNVVVTKDGARYREEQGWEIYNGAIKYATSNRDVHLASSDSIVVTYYYGSRIQVV